MYRHRFDKMRRLMARATWVPGVLIAATLMISACGGGGGGATSSPLGLIDQAARTVQLNLIITGSNFNGYSSGQMTVRVPRGWKVDVYCSNQASTPHSCAIVSGAGSTSPAFSGAASPDPVAGLPPGAAWNFSFVSRTVGSYRVTSLVPGHAGRGLWEGLDVVAGGHPSVSTSRRPATEPRSA